MFRIVCCAGIGDTVQNLCLFPHEVIYRKLGYRSGAVFMQFKIVEGESTRGAGLAHAEFPSANFFQGLVERCPSLRWYGQVETKKMMGMVWNRLVRETLRMANHGEPCYFPFHPTLTPDEQAALPTEMEGPLLGIQTHLTGMKTKRWGVANWSKFLELLLNGNPTLRIVLFDTAPAVKELILSPRISSTAGFHIAQSISLISRLDLLLSIDSWTKYVAKAHRIPQIIVVPDQRPEYPELTAEKLLEKHFIGLVNDPLITLIGFEPKKRALTLPSMADLSPSELATQVLAKLR